MHQASVGFHCPDCTRTGSQKVYRGVPTETPWLTYVLIGLNVAAFLVMLVVDGSGAIDGGLGEVVIDYGLLAKGISGGELIGVGDGEWYRLITSGFLHYGVFHLAMNMFMLYLLGRMLEPGGRLRMAIIYLVSLVGGSFGALLITPGALTVGASGAVFGLMGAIFMGHRSMGVDWRNSPLLNTIILNLVFTFALSRMISVGGHLGGLVGGGLAGWLLFDLGRREDLPRWTGPVLSGLIGVGCVIGAVLYAQSWNG